jgi:branched-chain amino acid transport system permease protein
VGALPGWLGRAVSGGLVAGTGMVYVAMVGLFITFADRPLVAGIGDEGGPGVLTLGRVILAAMPFVAGLLVGARLRRAADASSGWAFVIGASALSGVVAGALLGAFIVVTDVVDVRSIFIEVTPALVDFLAFEQEPVIGAVLLIAASTIIAGLAGALALLDARDRSAILTAVGVVIVVSILEPVLRPILGRMELNELNEFVFVDDGLTQAAAVVGLFGIAALSWAWARPAAPLRERVSELPADQRRNASLGIALAALLVLLLLPQVSTGFVNLVLVNVGFYLMLALGLNIVVGYAGLLDLGYVAFYAVGAYTTALLISPDSSIGGPLSAAFGIEWAFWLAIPIVMLVAALVGVFIGAPVLRLRGDYLAIVTLGFGEIARILFGSDALRPWVGGSGGVVGLPNLHVPLLNIELTNPGEYFYPVLVFAALAAFIAWRLSTSRTGRAWNAMREDETVAAATGVNITNYKLLAFALGGTLGGLAGALFAVQLRSVFPGSFLLIVSITTLAIIILGGMGTIRGVVVGALILVGLPEALRDFGQYRFLIYGAALVAMMILRPEGLFPSRIRQMELHEDAEPEEGPPMGESTEDVKVARGPIKTHGPGYTG